MANSVPLSEEAQQARKKRQEEATGKTFEEVMDEVKKQREDRTRRLLAKMMGK